MSLTSLQFAGFAGLTLMLYYLLPRRPQNILLLAASYAFYLSWSWFFALVLLSVTAVNFLIAPHLRQHERPRWRLAWLGIAFNLLALAVFKYENFFVPDLRAALHDWSQGAGLGALDVLLPVGMSFYVVAAISYLLDVARGQAEPSRDPVDFALYMAFFPKLLAGPIERARVFLPQLAAQRVVDNDALSRSFALVVLGITRKIVLADTLFRMLPRNVWRHPEQYSGLQLSIYLLIYALALYNDFAGYTSVARGVSGLFGLELSRNFNLPYFARTTSDFWNRWHITFSHWLRDYIYYPSSRALLRRNPRPTNLPNILIPPMLTMLASGLWHGTGWTFVLWGALHGAYLVGERVLAVWFPARPQHKRSGWRRWLSAAITFGLVALAWVPFNAPSLSLAWDYWWHMLDFTDLRRPTVRVLIAIIPALGLDWLQYRANDELVCLRWPRLVQAILLALVILAAFVLTQASTSTPFVYQGF